MFPCVVIGDSIAVGVGQNRPDCTTIAQVGINSDRYIGTLLPPGRMRVDQAVISLGVNDDGSLDTLGNLRAVRDRVSAKDVVWLLPGLKPEVRQAIRTVAAEYGDRMVDTRPEVGPDHLHPTGTGYQRIAASTQSGDSAEDAEEVAFAPPPRGARYAARGHDVRRHVSAYASPRERIRRLRELRQEEGPGRGSLQRRHAQEERSSGLANRLQQARVDRRRLAAPVQMTRTEPQRGRRAHPLHRS